MSKLIKGRGVNCFENPFQEILSLVIVIVIVCYFENPFQEILSLVIVIVFYCYCLLF